MQFHLRKHLPILWQEKLSNCSSTKETDSGRIKCLTPSLFRERGWAHFNSISSLLATSRSGSVTNGIKNRVFFFFFFASTTWQTIQKLTKTFWRKLQARKQASFETCQNQFGQLSKALKMLFFKILFVYYLQSIEICRSKLPLPLSPSNRVDCLFPSSVT